MPTLMDEAIDALRHVPADQQDDIARVVIRFAGVQPPLGAYKPGPAESAELDQAAAAADRGDFATDDEVRAIWAKHGL